MYVAPRVHNFLAQATGYMPFIHLKSGQLLIGNQASYSGFQLYMTVTSIPKHMKRC